MLIKSRYLVTGLLAAALGTVSLLGVQAAGSPTRTPLGGAPPGGAGRGATGLTRHGTGLPADSGTGERIVYSVTGARVWLVGADGRVARTFPVVGGNLLPALGPHQVFARRQGGRGGDGAAVEHVVLFTETAGMNIGFSAARDGSMARPDPGERTGAIRESRADAAALWRRAAIGSVVVVVR